MTNISNISRSIADVIHFQMSSKNYSKSVTKITSWLVSGQYEMRQAPTAFLNSLWAFSFWHLGHKIHLVLQTAQSSTKQMVCI